MKPIKTLGLAGLVLASCSKLPDIEINRADKVPDTNKVVIIPDTTIIPRDTIIYIPDTSYNPFDSIPKDTTINDTIIYTPKYYDENIFVNFEKSDYFVNDLFTYKAKISNLTGSKIKLNNTKENPAIKYTLYNGEEIVFEEPLKENFSIELNGVGSNDKGGYLGMEKREGLIDLIISRGKAEVDGKSYSVPTLEVVLTKPNKDFYFEKAGTHHMEVEVKYSVDGKNIENKFYSERFEVY